MTACQTGVAPLSEEDVTAIKAVGPALDEAALGGDWTGIGALFAEDAFLMPPNMASYEGRATVVEYIESAQLAITRHIIEFTEVDGYGDLAYARGTYDESYTMGDSDELIADVGKVLAILRRQPDGSWLITRWITNSDQPVPAAEGEHPEGVDHQ